MNEIIEYVTIMMKYGIKHKILGFETSEVGFETFYMELEIVRREAYELRRIFIGEGYL